MIKFILHLKEEITPQQKENIVDLLQTSGAKILEDLEKVIVFDTESTPLESFTALELGNLFVDHEDQIRLFEIFVGGKNKSMIDQNQSSEDEDPIIMYLVVRESLNMSIGKTGAQIGHAVQMLVEIWAANEFQRDQLGPEWTDEQFDGWEKWSDHSRMTKIILKADEKEWQKLKDTLPQNERVVVVDNGRTELAPGTETVIGVVPMRKSERPKILKRLQVLK